MPRKRAKLKPVKEKDFSRRTIRLPATIRKHRNIKKVPAVVARAYAEELRKLEREKEKGLVSRETYNTFRRDALYELKKILDTIKH